MQGNQTRKNTARTVIHNDINNYPYLIFKNSIPTQPLPSLSIQFP
ncbi:hypothetical protein [Bacillus cereus]|nr:hypothetical protein [Bacillus cereus]